jgi:cobalt/nickel transport system permease protein
MRRRGLDRHTLWLAAWFAAILAIPFVRSLPVIGALLLAAFLLGGRAALPLARRALLAILFFGGLVSVAYVLASLPRGGPDGAYLALLNLRAFLLCYLTLLCARRVDFLRALSFSREATYVFVLAFSQMTTFRRMLAELRLALRSRALGPLRLRDLYRHSAASGTTLIVKGLANAGEITAALRSRGFFDD